MFKYAITECFRSELLTSDILIILKQETYSHKYEKLPNIVIHVCQHIMEKMNLLKICGPQIQRCLFTLRPIASKQLHSLTTTVTLNWLGGAYVTHAQFPAPAMVFICLICFFVVVFFTFLSINALFVTKICNFYCNFNLLSILKLWQVLWPIIMV